jgi:hypothetical protein
MWRLSRVRSSRSRLAPKINIAPDNDTPLALFAIDPARLGKNNGEDHG